MFLADNRHTRRQQRCYTADGVDPSCVPREGEAAVGTGNCSHCCCSSRSTRWSNEDGHRGGYAVKSTYAVDENGEDFHGGDFRGGPYGSCARSRKGKS